MPKFSTILLINFLTSFALAAPADLSNSVAKEQLSQNANYVFSNTSVSGLLSLISFGFGDDQQQQLSAYWGGVSLEDKAIAMKVLNADKEGLIVSVNNQVWLNNNYEFLPDYVSKIESTYDVSPQTMNVMDPEGVAKEVNQWASDNTNELIKNVLKPAQVTPDVISILANAVYFKGTWEEEFNEELTDTAAFASAGDVDMMVKYGSRVKSKYLEQDGVAVIELPYKGGTHSMVIAMPAAVTGAGGFGTVYTTQYADSTPIAEVFQKYIVQNEAFSALETASGQDYSVFQMPKFEVESKIEGLTSKLESAGLKSHFGNGALSNMIDDSRAKISNMFQKAKIIVNEEGTEAAAVTVGIIRVTSTLPSDTYHLLINGPFAYAIRDLENNETLFEGVVTDPAAK